MKPKSLPVLTTESVLSPASIAFKYKNYGSDVLFTESVVDPSLIDMTQCFDATIVFICVSGRVKCRVDLEIYDIEKNSVFIIFPGQIVTILENDRARGHAMMISSSFINEAKLEKMKRMNFELYVGSCPLCKADDYYMDLLKVFYKLGKSVIEANGIGQECVIRGVAQACCGAIISCMKSGKEEEEKCVADDNAPNCRQIFERFLDLLYEYHSIQHSLGFYASQLSISPKYLSLVVKECSGRSVREWINEYVVRLAKSLLANSELSVNTVASGLHFKNQAAFGKYFKKQVGMGPREYRKSLNK